MKLATLAFAMLALLLLAVPSDAQWHARGAYYNGWAADAGNALNDDGVNGDEFANDGIFSGMVTSTEVAGDYPFKIAKDDESEWYPTTDVFLSLTEDNQTVLFTFDTNANGDGWFPDQNIVWADAVRQGSSWGLAGGAPELGDWDPASGPQAVLNGTVWEVEVDFANTGVYPYKWTADQNWDVQQLGADGYGSNAQNTTVNVVAPGVLQFKYDTMTGRGWVGAPPPPEPTWHARGSYYMDWGANDGNKLNDDGENGDAAAGDGIFSGFVTATVPAGDYLFKAGKSDWSESYPVSDIPLTLTEDNQVVFFTLDTNSHGDGWYPDQNIVWSDAVTPGTTWGLAGGAPELGDWEPANGPQAEWTGDYWEVKVVFPADGAFEYKWTADQIWTVQQLGFDGYGNNAVNIPLFVPEFGSMVFRYDPATGRGMHEFTGPPIATERKTWGQLKHGYAR